MSTSSNRAKQEEKKRSKEIDTNIKLLKIALIVFAVVWVILLVVVILFESERESVVRKAAELELEDQKGNDLVQGLGRQFSVIKGTLAILKSNFHHSKDSCEVSGEYEKNMGRELGPTFRGDWKLCQQECARDPACIVFSFVKSESLRNTRDLCFLKSDFRSFLANEKEVISGPKYCRSAILLKTFEYVLKNMTAFVKNIKDKVQKEKDFKPDYDAKVSENKFTILVSAPLPPGEVCPSPSGFLLGPRLGAPLPCPPGDWRCCSTHCSANSICKAWSQMGHGLCILFSSFNPPFRFHPFYKFAGTRACGGSMIFNFKKWFPQYQATYRGKGCHNATCKFDAASKITVSTPKEEDCLKSCFYASYPASQASYNFVTKACYCKKQNAGVPVKYEFHGGADHVVYNYS